jgi:riboflavin synthase
MFTGLIETTGSLVSRTPTAGATRLVVSAPALAGRWKTGDSIAVNGVCLTAIPIADPSHFAADLLAETIARTTLGSLSPGTTVNLELPTAAGAPMGGHIVQGHVDGVATLTSMQPLHNDLATSDWRLRLEVPQQLTTHIVQQGSITLDGISLTVAKLDGTTVEIAIIPHTYAATNLHTLTPGTQLNIETDVLAKYAAQRHNPTADWLTPAYLLANGY